MKPHTQEIEPAIAERAAQWLIELEDGGPQARAAFAAWLKESRRHVEEFLLATAVWKEFDGIDLDRRIELRELLAEASATIVPLGKITHRTRAAARVRSHPWRWVAGVAAIIVVSALGWLWDPFGSHGTHVFATTLGEQRAVKLEDGSIVHLNTRSRVDVRFSDAAREVLLLDGEALFTVERDPARPFRVMVGDTVIQAFGTQFNVYRHADGATVSVIEGVVQIATSAAEVVSARSAGEDDPVPPTSSAQERVYSYSTYSYSTGAAKLAAGEQANIAPDGKIVVSRAAPVVAEAVAWRERRLVFREDTLRDIAAEFNRYNALQIHVEDVAIGERQLTGVFDADDPESLLLFLAKDRDLLIDKHDDIVAISAR